MLYFRKSNSPPCQIIWMLFLCISSPSEWRASSQHTKFLIFFIYLILHGDSIAVHAVENITRWKCWPVQQYPVHSADIQREFKAPRISDCLPLCVPLSFGHICWYHIILAYLRPSHSSRHLPLPDSDLHAGLHSICMQRGLPRIPQFSVLCHPQVVLTYWPVTIDCWH